MRIIANITIPHLYAANEVSQSLKGFNINNPGRSPGEGAVTGRVQSWGDRSHGKIAVSSDLQPNGDISIIIFPPEHIQPDTKAE
jgi:hypothetical protein